MHQESQEHRDPREIQELLDPQGQLDRQEHQERMAIMAKMVNPEHQERMAPEEYQEHQVPLSAVAAVSQYLQ